MMSAGGIQYDVKKPGPAVVGGIQLFCCHDSAEINVGTTALVVWELAAT